MTNFTVREPNNYNGKGETSSNHKRTQQHNKNQRVSQQKPK